MKEERITQSPSWSDLRGQVMKTPPKLSDLGITKDQSSHWQKLARRIAGVLRARDGSARKNIRPSVCADC